MSSQKDLLRRSLRGPSRTARATIVIGFASMAMCLGLAAASGEAAHGEPGHTRSGLPAAVAGALEMPALQAYGPRPHEARLISVAGETWTLIPGADAAWCVDVGDVTLTCGTRSDIEAGALAITQIAAPVGEARVQLAEVRMASASGPSALPSAAAEPTAAVRRGLAPPGTSEVRAIDGNGQSISGATVTADGAYVLALGLEGHAAQIEFSATDGSTLAAVSAY